MNKLDEMLKELNDIVKVVPGVTKRCAKCKIVKPLDEFYKRSGDWKGKADRFGCLSKCKECAKQKTRDYWTRYKRAPVAACHICGVVEVLMKDHCHSTGMNRGMLCKRCNFGLGSFKDDPNRLLKAIEYLKRYGAI